MIVSPESRDEVKSMHILANLMNEKFESILEQKTIKEKFNFFFKENTLGTIDEMRCQLEMNYACQNFQIESSSKNKAVKLDCMAFLPVDHKNWENSEALDKRRNFLKQSFEKGNDGGSADRLMNDCEEMDEMNEEFVKNLVIMCQPNAAVYELLCYETKILNFYLLNGLTVVLWNYQGYGRSGGAPTMQNMVEDGKRVLRYVKERLKPKKVAIHGRSLGGQVAKSLSPFVDLMVADRTFSSISRFWAYFLGYVPRMMMGPYIQKVFDVFLDNYLTFVPTLVESECPKILLFDPKVILS
jgi:hypothetical protein